MIERQSSEASKAIKIQTPVGSRERERERLGRFMGV